MQCLEFHKLESTQRDEANKLNKKYIKKRTHNTTLHYFNKNRDTT